MALRQNIGIVAFKNIQQSPDLFYQKYSRPKMKFGSPQINKDGSFRMRDIIQPTYSLKLVQKEVNRQLKALELPGCMYGGVTRRNNIDNAYQHIKNKYFLTIDLKRFFNNITNSRIHQTLIGEGFTWEEARIITNLTTYKGSLPQGAPTSTTLANLAFAPTAIILEKLCKELDITFTVFVDDLTFSSSRPFRKHQKQILRILLQNGFFVNHSKIHYRESCCEVTGINIRRGKLSLPQEILKHQSKPGVKEYVASATKQFNIYEGINSGMEPGSFQKLVTQ